MIPGKLRIMITLLLLMTSLFGGTQPVRKLANDPINPGEILEFKLSYGWFTVGNATWSTDQRMHNYQGQECYKFKIEAESGGLLGIFAHVEDEWGEYARTADLMPMMAYRDLEEGRYILDEKTYFNYDTDSIVLETIHKGKRQPTQYFDMDKDRFGMIGGFMMMRTIDFDQYSPGDVIELEGFFEDEKYDVNVIYRGEEDIKTLVGRMRAHRVVPRLPQNRLFPGEDPVTVWFSADSNQLPLRASARMDFGTAYVELNGYRNIKFGPDYIDD
jgi:hypothetical protein